MHAHLKIILLGNDMKLLLKIPELETQLVCMYCSVPHIHAPSCISPPTVSAKVLAQVRLFHA